MNWLTMILVLQEEKTTKIVRHYENEPCYYTTQVLFVFSLENT